MYLEDVLNEKFAITHHLRFNFLYIFRSRSCDIVVSVRGVKDVHCQLEVDKGEVCIALMYTKMCKPQDGNKVC